MNILYENLRFIKDCFLFEVIHKVRKSKNIRKFKNIHKGQRCFIIGTGPSLRLEDVEALKNEYTFAVNSCFKVFDRTKWRPSYYVITDPKFIDDMGESLLKYDHEISCGFCGNETGWNGKNINSVYSSRLYTNFPSKGIIKRVIEQTGYNFMTKDLAQGIISGHTVVFSAVQIAEYMGFNEIYLLGIDCNYKGKLQYSELTAHTHINNPNAADLMIVDYLYVKRHFDANKKAKVFNATRGGKLEVFERVNLDDIIAR